MWTRTYLFLKSEGNASDGSLLDSLHQVSREAGDLVSESLGLDLTDVVNDSLIYMEVVGQPEQNDTKTRSFSSAIVDIGGVLIAMTAAYMVATYFP